MAKKGTGLNFFQQIQQAGAGFFGLGRRQKRKMQDCVNSIPKESLFVSYSNGMNIRYEPTGVEGQLLRCDAWVTTPEVPQEVLESNTLISMFEFNDKPMRRLFQKYHEAFMCQDCLQWESDNVQVTSSEILGENIEVGIPPSPKDRSKGFG